MAEVAAFELARVSVRYQGAFALSMMDLSIPANQTTALLGTSGAGKSTLIRLLNGLIRPDQGEVRFRGQPLPADLAAVRRRMGYVLQGGALFPHLTAEANVALVARFLGTGDESITKRVGELADLARVPREALRRYPSELSGGQAQRVGLMRALMLDPEVLLLDEPLGALDPITRRELQEDLRAAFARLGKTVVLVTHDLGEAAFFAHRLVLLRKGAIVQQGTLRDLRETPADPFVTQFLAAQRPLPELA